MKGGESNMSNEWTTANSSGSTLSAKDLEDLGTVQGIYISKEEGIGDNNNNVYNLEIDGEVTSMWGSTVLDSAFSKIRPGQEVNIKFLGKEKNPKSGRTYNNFEVKFRDALTDSLPDTDIDELLK